MRQEASEQTTDTRAIERQLDEPAPILVWRSGLRNLLPPIEYTEWFAVFPSKDDAERAAESYLRTWPNHFEKTQPPSRLPIEDALTIAAYRGYFGVRLCDGECNVIEEYII